MLSGTAIAWQGAGEWTMSALETAKRQGYDTVVATSGFTETFSGTVHTDTHVVTTDAGDVSSLMPFIHISTGGYDGDAHSKDFTICDPEMAYVMPARAMAMTVIDLLWDGAAKARAIRESFRPKFTRETYLQFWDRFCAGTVDRSSF